MNGSQFEDQLTTIKRLKRHGDARAALHLLNQQPPEMMRLKGCSHLKGSLCQDLGQWEEAIQFYREELLYHPNYVHSHINLGVIWYQQKKYREAIAAFKLAVLTGPGEFLPYYNLGNVMRTLGRYQEAVVYYQRALAIHPGSREALINVSPLLRQLNRHAEARDVYERILQLDPDNAPAKHFFAALNGENTARAPQEYIEQLFDDYSVRFDESLTKNLRYDTPQKFAVLLKTYLKPLANDKPQLKGLDLGCGTGLGVAALNSTQVLCTWTGIDLSQKMLDVAAGKDLYQTLIKSDVVSYVHQTPETYDVMICLDTVPYLGCVRELLEGMARILSPGGYVGLSIEGLPPSASTEKDYELQATGRFCHSNRYIHERACNAGLQQVAYEDTIIRHNSGNPVHGSLFIFRKT